MLGYRCISVLTYKWTLDLNFTVFSVLHVQYWKFLKHWEYETELHSEYIAILVVTGHVVSLQSESFSSSHDYIFCYISRTQVFPFSWWASRNTVHGIAAVVKQCSKQTQDGY